MGDAQQGAGRLGGHRPHHHLLHLLLHPVTLAMMGGLFGCMRVVQTCGHLLSEALLSQKQLVAFFLDVSSQFLKPAYLGTLAIKKWSKCFAENLSNRGAPLSEQS